MKYKREERVKILEYKFVFEEELQIQKEYQEGSSDLNYRLSFFRNKLKEQEGQKAQQDLYDKMFMGGLSDDTRGDLATCKPDQPGLAQSATKISSNEKPWVKKTHRQIVMVTHPDRTIGVQSSQLREKLTEQYRIAQESYNSGHYSDLVMIAFDLNISVPDHVINEEITPSLEIKKNKINNIKKMIGWQWYHVPDKQKDAELKKILSCYGFKFTDLEVEKAIRKKYVKRKMGTRPEKINVKRKRSK